MLYCTGNKNKQTKNKGKQKYIQMSSEINILTSSNETYLLQIAYPCIQLFKLITTQSKESDQREYMLDSKDLITI